MKRLESKKTNKGSDVQNVEYPDFNDYADYVDGDLAKGRNLVKQSYDKVLTSSEKVALTQVVDEEKEYKDKIEFLKRKKERDREDRLERIKKMKLNNNM
jgi:hypothetical protein